MQKKKLFLKKQVLLNLTDVELAVVAAASDPHGAPPPPPPPPGAGGRVRYEM